MNFFVQQGNAQYLDRLYPGLIFESSSWVFFLVRYLFSGQGWIRQVKGRRICSEQGNAIWCIPLVQEYKQLEATLQHISKPQVKSNTHSLQGFNGVLSPKHHASNLRGEKSQIYSVEILLFPLGFLSISFEVSTQVRLILMYYISAKSPLIFNNFQISVYWLPEAEPYIDRAALAHADYFLALGQLCVGIIDLRNQRENSLEIQLTSWV